ncbi:MAG: DNA polymerase Y family protein [Acidimicrobiia bacterium]
MPERTICVWCPSWPLGRPDAPSDSPFFVVGAQGVTRVVAADPLALSAGVTRGMPRREAEGLCPAATVLVRDLDEEWRRFEPVVRMIEEIVPQVEVVEPGLALVPVSGAVRYYGDEESVVEILSGKLTAAEVDARIGLADGPFAATWAARVATSSPLVITDTRSFLASLDISAIDHDDLVSTFRWLGVTTLGALADLPRDAIASRFGDVGLTAHRLSHGEDRIVDPRRIPPELAVESRFEEPLELTDQVAFAARGLAVKLIAGLRREGIAPHRIVIEAELDDGEVRSRVWRSSDPFTDEALADRVRWQCQAWVDEGRRSGGGIVRLRLDPSDLSGDGRQLGFFTDEAARVEAERALARVQTLVGPDAVLEAEAQGGRMPSERVAWFRWQEQVVRSRDEAAPWPGTTPAPTPALVPPEPVPVEVEWDDGMPVRIRLGARWEPVLTWAGPWRLTGSWWRGEPPIDRYQLVTSAGAFLVLVRSSTTYLAGVYD